jgi:hypothetical protein
MAAAQMSTTDIAWAQTRFLTSFFFIVRPHPAGSRLIDEVASRRYQFG